MITRFRLEAEGESQADVQKQLGFAVDEMVEHTVTDHTDWEITDSVFGLNKAETRRLRRAVWCGRIVMKLRRENDGADVATAGNRSHAN